MKKQKKKHPNTGNGKEKDGEIPSFSFFMLEWRY